MTAAARTHARLFRALLRAYPAWFRAAHGDEMTQLFLARLHRAHGPVAVLRLWSRTVRDAASTALAFRRDRQPHHQPGPRPAGGSDMLWQDIRFGIRHLLRTPVFTLGAVALLAVGIGANVAVFSLVDHLMLRPLAFDRIDEVVYVYQDDDDGEPSSASFPATRDMARSSVFSAVTATSPANLSWDRDGESIDVVAEFATASYIDVAGRPPLRGRWFSAEHDAVGAAPVAVVSAAAWRSRFGSDPGIVGRTIRLNDSLVTIIGVGPDGLSGTFAPIVTDFWLSISATVAGGQSRVANLERREDHWYDVRARLAEGVTVEQAQEAMNALALRLAEEFPELNRGRGLTVRPASEVYLFPEAAGTLTMASAIVVTLLVLACANLANLLLVRGIGRSGEMAIRRALGAGPARVARLFLVEALILAVVGGVAGVALAGGALAALQSAPLPSPFSNTLDVSIDGRVTAFAVALMAATGVLFGLAPALRSRRDGVAAALRDETRTSSIGRGTVRLRSGLVVVQVAGSLVLILATGLLGRSLMAMQRADTGVDADRLAFIRANVSAPGNDAAANAVLLEDVRSRLASLPGVTHAAAAHRLPAMFSGTTTTIVEGYTPQAGTNAVELDFVVVSPQYFDTVGLPILEGRGFLATDVVGTDRVVIVNAEAARRFWGGEEVIGRRLRSQGQPDVFRTVVGVAADAPVATYPEDPTRPAFYIPSGQANVSLMYFLVRTDGDPGGLLPSMRTAVTDVRSAQAIAATGTMTDRFGAALSAPRFVMRVVGTVSGLAVLLAALGIYAVVAFNVARRSGELGIRVALGAQPGGVVRMVMGETMGAVGLGIAGGLALAVLAARPLEAVLFGVRPLDPITFAGAVAFLVAVAGLAAWLPARRAAQADPVQALRAS